MSVSKQTLTRGTALKGSLVQVNVGVKIEMNRVLFLLWESNMDVLNSNVYSFREHVITNTITRDWEISQIAKNPALYTNNRDQLTSEILNYTTTNLEMIQCYSNLEKCAPNQHMLTKLLTNCQCNFTTTQWIYVICLWSLNNLRKQLSLSWRGLDIFIFKSLFSFKCNRSSVQMLSFSSKTTTHAHPSP